MARFYPVLASSSPDSGRPVRRSGRFRAVSLPYAVRARSPLERTAVTVAMECPLIGKPPLTL